MEVPDDPYGENASASDPVVEVFVQRVEKCGPKKNGFRQVQSQAWMIRFRAASKWMITSTALEVSPMQVEDIYHNLGIGPGLYSLYPSKLGG